MQVQEEQLTRLSAEQIKLIAEPYMYHFNGKPDGFLRVEHDDAKVEELARLPISLGLARKDAAGDIIVTDIGAGVGAIYAKLISDAIAKVTSYRKDGPERRLKASRKQYSDLAYLLEFHAAINLNEIIPQNSVVPYELAFDDGKVSGYWMEDIPGTHLGQIQIDRSLLRNEKESLEESLRATSRALRRKLHPHGDLKMSNFICTRENTVKLIDPRALVFEDRGTKAILINQTEDLGFGIEANGHPELYSPRIFSNFESKIFNATRKAVRMSKQGKPVFVSAFDLEDLALGKLEESPVTQFLSEPRRTGSQSAVRPQGMRTIL